jgi:hypothetical protein
VGKDLIGGDAAVFAEEFLGWLVEFLEIEVFEVPWDVFASCVCGGRTDSVC